MRICLVLCILAIYLQGCCNCNQVNEFGKCIECNKCSRSKISYKWEKKELGKPFACAAMELTDQVFLWEDVYNKLWDLRKHYFTLAKNCEKWCALYSKCNMKKAAWENYWQTLFAVAIKINQVKKVLIERLSFLRGKGNISREEARLIRSLNYHLTNQFMISSDKLIKIGGQLQAYTAKLPLTKLTKAEQDLKDTIKKVVKDHTEEPTLSSDHLLSQLDVILEKVKNVTPE